MFHRAASSKFSVKSFASNSSPDKSTPGAAGYAANTVSSNCRCAFANQTGRPS